MSKQRTDRKNTKCSCGGNYREATIYDDWDSKVTCSKCKKRIYRYDPPKAIKIVIPVNKDGNKLNPFKDHKTETKRTKITKQDYTDGDLIFSLFDRMFLDGDFETPNLLLEMIEPSTTGLLRTVGILTATFAAKNKLPSRAQFFLKAKQFIEETEGTRSAAILHGLE